MKTNETTIFFNICEQTKALAEEMKIKGINFYWVKKTLVIETGDSHYEITNVASKYGKAEVIFFGPMEDLLEGNLPKMNYFAETFEGAISEDEDFISTEDFCERYGAVEDGKRLNRFFFNELSNCEKLDEKEIAEIKEKGEFWPYQNNLRPATQTLSDFM